MISAPIGSSLASTPIVLAASGLSPLAKTFSGLGNTPASLRLKARLGNTDAKIELAAKRGDVDRLKKYSGAVVVKIAAFKARLAIASGQARIARSELEAASVFDRSRALSVGACKAQNKNYEIYDYARGEYVAARAEEQGIQARLDGYRERHATIARHLETLAPGSVANSTP
jgi:hypothetical protein